MMESWFNFQWNNGWAILGLSVITVLSRGFFVLSDQAWKLPHWLERSLEYAPIAALLAVIAPEVFTLHGEWIHTWLDARWMACLAGVLYYVLLRERNPSLLGVIVVGMAVYLPLHIWAGA
jgi:branched-subunit amino acid transport protein